MISQRRRYYQDPPIVTTPLELGQQSWFSVIVPKARTNEVTNGSGETNTTGYTAGAGSLARSTAQQYHGAYSFAYTPSAAVNDGFYYTLTSTIALRAISCKFLGQKGLPYALTYSTNSAVDIVAKTFIATGKWQWIYLYANETSAVARLIMFRKNGGTNTTPFYVDGVQSEVLADASESVSTYIDGDQQGMVPNQNPAAFYWTGTPHASTSVRSGLTRAGGEVKYFSNYSFLLTAIIGLGMAVPQNVAMEYARIDGGFDDYTRKPTRQFTLTGRFDATSPDLLDANRSGLSSLLDRDLVGLDQRLLLRYEKLNERDQPVSDAALIPSKYQGGLEGNVSSLHQEAAPITFTQYLPVITAEGSQGASLTAPANVSNSNFVIKRNAAGVWSALSTGLTGGLARTVLPMPDGTVIVAGDFTGAGGVANTGHIARYNPTTDTFSALGTGASGGNVYNLATNADGSLIFAVGTATSFGGVANTKFAAKWNGAAWSPLGAGFTLGSGLFAVVYSSPTIVYVAGDTATVAGVVGYNPTADTLGGVLPVTGSQIRSLALSSDQDTLYIGGSALTAINGVGITNIGSYKISTGATGTMAAGVNNIVDSIALGVNGYVYAGGTFTASTAGATLNRIGQFNGTAWQPMGTGMNAEVSRVAVAPDGSVWAAGLFTTANGLTLLGGVAIWSSGTWTFPDFVAPSTPDYRAIAFTSDGSVYLGFNSSGTGAQGAATVLTNGGTAKVYPTFRINGPGSSTAPLYLILNRTNGRAIYFNYTVQTGEVMLLTLQPDNLSFVSNLRGSINYAIRPGSNVADFFLQPGANNCTFYAGSVTIDSYWQPAYTRLDGLTR